ncbi:protein [Plasmopara halstedii]|uniref:Protein n=1 Tax=Plasmopara halstedii TaxID=4781 RepID=A0A0P1AIG6_PLAHL|nr:protein [Plasmopara halstedii]CEG40959.1 protein [Plasmopara halstedii]|eukprot:XP_024577328.1 protein [Plasmopara halstedii]
MGNAAAKQTEAQAPPAPVKTEEKSSTQKQPSFRVLSAGQRSITFDERVHLRANAEARAERVMLGLGATSEFRPLQRAATFDPRLRSEKQLLTVSDVMHRRFFNARERRVSACAERNLFRIAESDKERQEAIVIVDPYSTGMTMAEKVLERGYLCICVYSDTLEVTQERIAHGPKDMASKFLAIIYHDGIVERQDETKALQDTVAALRCVKNVDIIGIFAGAETGVLLADKLSEHFKLTTNGTNGSIARRNKYFMGEKVRSAGVRAVAQVQATKWSQVENFVQNELLPMLKGEDFKVIVKPVESAGSDDVALCHSIDEVRTAFGNIQGKINGLGLENHATLVQEYLDGTEYVVDTVSRNGVTKVVAVWEYDKRAVNGAPFVYYGVLLRAAPDGSVLAKVAEYVIKVVEALEIVHGPAHAEVKVVRGEPCLVEIGARCHGGSGSYLPIVMPCLGYNHVDAALDSYLDGEAFERLPERPTELRSHGCEAMLVSYEAGKLASYPGKEELETLSSTVSTMWFTHVGDELKPTIDMFSTPGSVIMVNENEEQLNRDYARIRELEHKGMYALEPQDEADIEAKNASGIVVVVDPFSTGAVLAHELMIRGYDCICVYSDHLENIESVASLVPEGLMLEFAATVAFDGNLEETVSAIRKAAEKVADKKPKIKLGVSSAIRAVFAGAELGVKLSDALIDALGLQGNVMKHANARRDKYLMGEVLRSAGLRAAKQVKATTWDEAEKFITQDLKPEPFEVVLKPLESAGTEDVILCLSMEEARRTFDGILGKINGLGIENEAVLLQEYLEGDEYVVDTVSRDGEHKVTAIWKYDKRRVNDAAFVYFGLSLVPAEGIVNEIIDYQFQVLDALGIRNGPAHGEVKFCRGSPVLIEVGSRCHGGEGAWVPIANICVGYNQVTATIDSILVAEAFAKLCDRPRKLLAYGCEAMLVSYKTGVLKSTPGISEIEKMPAFLKKEIFVSPGDNMRQTVDMFTTPGSIMLTHKDRDILESNLSRIRELEVEGLFEVE